MQLNLLSRNAIALGLVTIVTGTSAALAVGHGKITPATAVFWLLLLAVANIAKNRTAADGQDSRRRRRAWLAAGEFATAVVLVALTPVIT
jgi:hypothetical protein